MTIINENRANSAQSSKQKVADKFVFYLSACLDNKNISLYNKDQLDQVGHFLYVRGDELITMSVLN